jgi:hypothetical protein
VAESVTATRDPILIRATKKRRDFYQKIALADRDSLETWSSSQMECRPFKDPSFDKYMLEQDTASQAIPDTKDTAAQTVQLRCSRTYIDLLIWHYMLWNCQCTFLSS